MSSSSNEPQREHREDYLLDRVAIACACFYSTMIGTSIWGLMDSSDITSDVQPLIDALNDLAEPFRSPPLHPCCVLSGTRPDAVTAISGVARCIGDGLAEYWATHMDFGEETWVRNIDIRILRELLLYHRVVALLDDLDQLVRSKAGDSEQAREYLRQVQKVSSVKEIARKNWDRRIAQMSEPDARDFGDWAIADSREFLAHWREIVSASSKVFSWTSDISP